MAPFAPPNRKRASELLGRLRWPIARLTMTTMLKTAIFITLSLSSAAAARDCAWIEEFSQNAPSLKATACSDTHCQWDFAYRDGQGRAFFADMSETLTACVGPLDAVDDPVNHPDSYHLQAFSSGDVTLYLSLKDKSSLGKTFVFLRRD